LKKAILIAVSASMLLFLTAFNYVLWQNEQYSITNDGNETRISWLNRDINELRNANSALESDVRELERLRRQNAWQIQEMRLIEGEDKQAIIERAKAIAELRKVADPMFFASMFADSLKGLVEGGVAAQQGDGYFDWRLVGGDWAGFLEFMRDEVAGFEVVGAELAPEAAGESAAVEIRVLVTMDLRLYANLTDPDTDGGMGLEAGDEDDRGSDYGDDDTAGLDGDDPGSDTGLGTGADGGEVAGSFADGAEGGPGSDYGDDGSAGLDRDDPGSDGDDLGTDGDDLGSEGGDAGEAGEPGTDPDGGEDGGESGTNPDGGEDGGEGVGGLMGEGIGTVMITYAYTQGGEGVWALREVTVVR